MSQVIYHFKLNQTLVFENYILIDFKGLLPPSRPGTQMPTNCRELKTIGHMHSGFYTIRGSTTSLQTVYCDFSQINSESMITLLILMLM